MAIVRVIFRPADRDRTVPYPAYYDHHVTDGARAMVRPVLQWHGTTGGEETLCIDAGQAGEHLTTLLHYLMDRGVSASVRY